MFNRITESLRRFMTGRYGVDQLSVALLVLGMVLSLSVSLFDWWPLSIVYWVVVFVCFFRILSRNAEKRMAENQGFMQLWRPVSQRLAQLPTEHEMRKKYCLFKCPHCGQKLRMPKGKGMVEVTCHNCSTKFKKKT